MGSLSRYPDMEKESTGFCSGAVEVFQKIADRRNIKMMHMEREIYERNPERVKETDI